ncbi:MAG: LacI family DNA-binding transcriptional regulator [Chloroflexi bacterium]|nr:LacI family DNA-binding transcriptional regulator [Chloroflexota bacterium]
MTDARGPRRQKVTLQHVADAAKVSKATASLALNNNPRISEATRKRVLAAVESLGYVYNQRAASLRTQRSFTVACIIHELSNPFSAELTSGAESQLAARGFSLLLGTAAQDHQKQARMVKTMLERDVDGIILSPVMGTDSDTLGKIAEYCPLVLTTGHYESLDIDSVDMDNENGAARGVEYLVENGHKRIAFIGGAEERPSRQSRLLGYRKVLQKHKIPFDPSLCIASAVTRRGGYDAAQQVLALANPPTAAFCYCDVNAFGVMLGLRAAGIEAGKDFAVVGFDNVAEASLWQPSLTTVATDPTALGEQMARLMLQRIAEPDMPIQRVIMPSQLIVRDSTAALVKEPR